MHRNAFGDPRPSNASEISAALSELDMLPRFASAMIDEPWDTNVAPFIGWVAVIMDVGGENSFTTTGFASRSDLEAALREAGIQNIEEGW
ncbi:hypothetical protein ACEYYA_02410 [Paracoccus sp. p3-h83]|uniref:hypothetical protein n=1 Tax=Paracoccus sp. p3-h83 TaxID=3342805 RepID=UPI0035BB9405